MAKTTLHTIASIKTPDGKIYSAIQDITESWNHYSKTWHGQYGSYKIYANRRVELCFGTPMQTKVIATYDRWPNSLKGIPGSSGYLAILKCLDLGVYPLLLGINKELDECIKYFLSKGMKHG